MKSLQTISNNEKLRELKVKTLRRRVPIDGTCAREAGQNGWIYTTLPFPVTPQGHPLFLIVNRKIPRRTDPFHLPHNWGQKGYVCTTVGDWVWIEIFFTSQTSLCPKVCYCFAWSSIWAAAVEAWLVNVKWSEHLEISHKELSVVSYLHFPPCLTPPDCW